MTPAARVQSAIELLDAIIVAARDGGASADTIAQRFFAERRYAGSKDRRAVRELTWRAIRRFGERPVTGRAAMVALADENSELADLFGAGGYGPDTIIAGDPRAAGDALPTWLLPMLSDQVDSEEERAALLERAPLDLRVNALKAAREAVLAELPEAEGLEASPMALRLPTGTVVDGHAALTSGRAEIQDLGSQVIVDACGVAPNMTVLDLCAGAGGKTLALAAAMQGKGRLIAADTNRARLSQLSPRAERAGASFVETRLLDPGKEAAMLADIAGKCDIVLIDAPCSGSGTWRRNPETRWRLNEARLKQVLDMQTRLLNIGAEMVAPGGHIVYAVCSLIANEGREQMAAFLERNEGFRAQQPSVPAGRVEGDGVLLTPYRDQCDGFFFAKVQKL